jgi:hypothetical protein
VWVRRDLSAASEDGTVKIWDCRALKANSNIGQRSQLTYNQQGGHITSLAVCENMHAVVSGSTNGSVHVFKVGLDGGGASSAAASAASSPQAEKKAQYLAEVKKVDTSAEGPVVAVRASGHCEWSTLTRTADAVCFAQVDHFNTLTESLVVRWPPSCLCPRTRHRG